MGSTLSSAFICRRIPDLRILIMGLDAAGKTAILYRLKTGELVNTIPTIGFNVELVTVEGKAKLTMWDMGGRDKMRPLYRHYYPNTHGALYIVDGTDQDRLSESVSELKSQCQSLEDNGVGDIPVALLCNKSDLNPDAVAETFKELQDIALSISSPKSGRSRRPCRCFEVSAASGAGLTEAIEWLIGAALHELPNDLLEEDMKPKTGEVGKVEDASPGWRSNLYGLVKSVMLR